AFIQMNSEQSASQAALFKHHKFMNFGKKQRYIEVFSAPQQQPSQGAACPSNSTVTLASYPPQASLPPRNEPPCLPLPARNGSQEDPQHPFYSHPTPRSYKILMAATPQLHRDYPGTKPHSYSTSIFPRNLPMHRQALAQYASCKPSPISTRPTASAHHLNPSSIPRFPVFSFNPALLPSPGMSIPHPTSVSTAGKRSFHQAFNSPSIPSTPSNKRNNTNSNNGAASFPSISANATMYANALVDSAPRLSAPPQYNH
ncbi:Uncharacterized protein FKW44_008590, partial [Caligus rogercresseyi]